MAGELLDDFTASSARGRGILWHDGEPYLDNKTLWLAVWRIAAGG
jgi:hypothetical protein